MSENKQILVADDEPNLRRVLSAQLTRDGFDVFAVDNGRAAIELLAEHHIDVVVTDLRMPEVDGMALLRHVVAHYPEVPVILITAHGTIDTAVEALKLGAFDYVTKPFDRDELRAVIDKAARTRDLAQRDVALSGKDAGRFRIIGQSPVMANVYQVIDRIADTPSTVLITGESGTGKELIARALHDNSGRRDRPFIRVNCAAIPRDLIESELFGYEKGAFTGAVAGKPGRFELADEGTLFLDEIGDVPLNMQVKLLRALQEQEFERVGGIRTLKVDVRLVTATNRDLETEIAAGRFREDLYYRLNVVRLHLPPLRERKTDIPLLVEHFVRRFNERLHRQVTSVSDDALAIMLGYAWKGNIRELENVIERCMLFCDGDEIQVDDLPPELRRTHEHGGSVPPVMGPFVGTTLDSEPPSSSTFRRSDNPDSPTPSEVGLKEAVREATARIERDLIERALKQTGGNVTHTARLLKISRKGLQLKMKELGLREGGVP